MFKYRKLSQVSSKKSFIQKKYKLIKIFYGHEYTDLGPFRAIRRKKLEQLNLSDRTFGWTVEMQIKAIQLGFTVVEIPVDYRRRIGKSKISGTLSGTIKAGIKKFGRKC